MTIFFSLCNTKGNVLKNISVLYLFAHAVNANGLNFFWTPTSFKILYFVFYG